MPILWCVSNCCVPGVSRIAGLPTAWRESGLNRVVGSSACSAQAAPQDNQDLAKAGVVLGFAYPDRIAQRRAGPGNRFLLSNGRGASFSEAEPLAASDYVVAAHLDGARDSRIYLATEIYREDLLNYHSDRMTEHSFVDWDEAGQCVQARRQLRLGALILEDAPWQQVEAQAVQSAMLQGIRRHAPACLPWTEAARQLQARVSFVHRTFPGQWPDFSDVALMAGLDDWLSPYLDGITRLTQLKRLDLYELLLARLSWQQRKQLDELAPRQLTVPSGSRISIDYDHEIPVLAVRLQELFGLTETPRIAGGRVPVLLHLLSPARRPVQITRDLDTFWQGSYHEVRKEMKGRYPKHDWPDDPLVARPTTRTRRKK